MKKHEGKIKKTVKKKAGKTAAKRSKKTPAANARKKLLAELAELAVSPKVTAAMAADTLQMTPAAFQAFLQDDAEAGRVWRNAQTDALRKLGKTLWKRADGGDMAATRQLLQGLQDTIGTSDLAAMSIKAVAALIGEKPAKVDYWMRKGTLPKNADGTLDLKVFLEWWRRHLISEHTFNPLRVETVPELVPLAGVSKETIYEWLKKGMPRNRDGSFSLPEVFRWRLEQVGGKPQGQPEKANPLADKKAEKLQLELDKAKRQLVPREAVEMGLATRTAAVVQFVDRKSRELPGMLAGHTAEDIKEALDKFSAELRAVCAMVPEDIREVLPAERIEPLTTLLSAIAGGTQDAG